MKTTLKIVGRIYKGMYGYYYRCIDKYDSMFFFYSHKELEYNSYISLEYRGKNVYKIQGTDHFQVYKSKITKLYIKNNVLVDCCGNIAKSQYLADERKTKDGKVVIKGEPYKIKK